MRAVVTVLCVVSSACLINVEGDKFHEAEPGSLADRDSWYADPANFDFGYVPSNDDAATNFFLYKEIGGPTETGYRLTVDDPENFIVTRSCNDFINYEVDGRCIFYVTYRPVTAGDHVTDVRVGPWPVLRVWGETD